MKKVEAIIRPFKLDELKEGLDRLGVQGMTVTEVRGYGRSGGKVALYPGAEYVLDFVPKYKVEIVIPDEQVHAVIEAVQRAAYTGETGDGKVFVARSNRSGSASGVHRRDRRRQGLRR
ncbi:MAG: P-II family nitrogen regulator, partial [Myxococcales bacterium]|nr:P-II family nitrogen regulator [Myxococcales bacterium]